MKKALRILRRTLLVLLFLLLALWLLLQTPGFQTWLAQTAASRLSKALGTTVSIKKARFVLLNTLTLEDLVVADKKKDTLLFAGEMRVNMSDWFFMHDSADLNYIGLKNVTVNLQRSDSIWNYKFLVDFFSSPKKSDSKGGIALHLKVVDLDNIVFYQNDYWRGRSLIGGVGKLHLEANQIDFNRNIFDVETVTLVNPQYREFKKYGLWTLADSARYELAKLAARKADSLAPPSTDEGLQLLVKNVLITNGVVEIYNRPTEKSPDNFFDTRDILITELTGKLTDVKMQGDTLSSVAHLSARERSGLHLKQLNTRFTMTPQLMEFADLDLQINNSRLGNYYAMRYNSIDDMEEFIDSVHLTARLQNSTINLPDIGYFAPLLFDRKQTATISGDATGTISNFFIKNLDIKTGQSHLTGDYSMKGLVDVDRTIINWQTKGSKIALPDVAVWYPDLMDLKQTPVGNLGVVTYQGNFKGTVYNFVAKGNINSAVGSANIDFALAMDGPKKGFKSIITNAQLAGGKLLEVKQVGHLDFDGTVSSNGFGANNPLMISGYIRRGEYQGYPYQNLQVNGTFVKNILTAQLAVSDDNLAGSFETMLNFNVAQQHINGRGILSRANLKALGFTKDSLGFSGEFDVDFKGKKIDEFLGYARFYNARFYLGSKKLNFDSLVVNSYYDSANAKALTLQTNEADVKLHGRFNIAELGNSFQYFLSRYYPAFIPAPKTIVRNQDFTFDVKTREIEPYLALVDAKLHGLNFATISGRLNTDSSILIVNADVPNFQYDKLIVTNTNLVGQGSLEKLNVLGKIDNIQFNDSLNFSNAILNIKTNYDTTSLLLTTTSQGPLGKATVDATVYSKPNGFDVNFNESSIIVNNKKWVMKESSRFSLANKKLESPGITLEQDDQQIHLLTLPDKTGDWNNVHIAIKNINTGDILPYVLTNPRLEGQATGLIVIENPLKAPLITAELSVDQFRFNNDSIGLLTLNGIYNVEAKTLEAKLNSNNADYDLNSVVKLNLNDSADEQINTTVPIKHARINFLRTYLDAVFDDIDGYANGELRLVGKLNAPRLLGQVMLTEGVIKVGYTKCVYAIDSARLKFGYNYIDLGTLNIKDEKNRPGTVDGILYHSFFDSLSFNLKMRTPGMTVLNTRSTDNTLFYGNATANASLDLTGPLNNMIIRIAGKPTDSSHIFINTKESRESADADFIVFKTYGTDMVAERSGTETNFTLDLDLSANNLCKIDVILDELTGDVIKATGNGNMKIHTGSNDATEMRGRYNIENGIYDYKFQTLIRKPFLLLPNGNNYIEWNGDPYDANMNISAVYEAKNVSLSSLVGNNNNTLLDASAQSYTGNVNVVAVIKGRLSKPNIDFEIEFPPGSSMANNLSVQEMMRRIKDDATEKLRQVTYLIVFKSFAPFKEGSSNRNPGTDLAVNTITELLSREMGKILSDVVHKITGDQSLNVDISTNFYSSSQLVGGNVVASNYYDRVKVDFNLNKSYFNNRVVINVGSDFDVNVRSTVVTGFQFLPDISAEFILTPNRRLRFIVFKRDNLDFSGRRNRAGASISYRKDYDMLFGNSEDALFMSRKVPVIKK